MKTPAGAHYYLDRNYYRIGVRGMVFIWTGEDWIRSTRSVGEIKAGDDVVACHKKAMKQEVDGL